MAAHFLNKMERAVVSSKPPSKGFCILAFKIQFREVSGQAIFEGEWDSLLIQRVENDRQGKGWEAFWLFPSSHLTSILFPVCFWDQT